MPAMFLTWLERDRERFGYTAAKVAPHLGIACAEYLAIEAGGVS